MHSDLFKDYKKRILPNIEAPIREVVEALWQLPFIVDTNEACSGHIVTNNYMKSLAQFEPIRKGLYWYPHGVRLGMDLSLEDGLKEQGASFRRDISSIDVDIGLRASESERGYKTVDGNKTKVLHVWYDSAFPDRDLEPPQTGIADCIENTHARLVAFWEAFAQVIRKYNQNAEISPIADKNFLKIIDWADLGDLARYIIS